MRKGIIFSFVIHLLLLLIVFFWRPQNSSDDAFGVVTNEFKVPAKPLQVRTLSENQLKDELSDALEKSEQQIVQGDDSLKSEKAGKRQGKVLLSKHHQAVDFETRAEHIGKFKNVNDEGDENGEKSAPLKEAQDSVAKADAHKAEAPAKDLSKLFQLAPTEQDREPMQAQERNTGRLRSPASVGKKGEGFSATDDYLKDVAVGASTILNTREFKFYGFYERIREKLAHHWHVNLEQAYDKLFAERKTLNSREQLTQVQVRLDERGQVNAVRVIGSSGFDELDSAAADAFKRAAPFPNPPTEMLDAQKTVVLRWDFVVVADEGMGMRVRVKRPDYR